MGTLRVRSLLDDAPGSPFSALLISMKPHALHPPLRHAKTFELFLVLDGEVEARIDGRVRRLRAGNFALLPPGCVHGFRAGKKGVNVLAVFSPPLDRRKPDIVMLET